MVKNRFFWLLRVLLVIGVIYIPLNGLVGLLLTHSTGNEYWKLIATLMITAVSISIIFFGALFQTDLTQKILKRPYNVLAFLYIGAITLYSIPFDGYVLAHAYGWLIDCRYVLVFIAAQIAYHDLSDRFRLNILRALFVTACAVSIVALAEVFVPHFADSLIAAGYWVTNLSVDENTLFGRASGTLRGPNELGAYLAALFFVGLVVMKNQKFMYIAPGALLLAALYLTYSRSAYLGLFCGIATLIIMLILKHRKYLVNGIKKHIGIVLISSILIVGGTVFAAYTTGLDIKVKNYVSIVLLHNDPNSIPGPNSDDMRLKYWQMAIDAVADKPFGYGVGSTGLASPYMNRASVTENYYLQILVETGIVGLILFIAFVGYTLKRLLTNSPYIGASLLAVLVATAFLHTMADEAVATVLWFVCGLMIITNERKNMGIKSFLFKLKEGTEEENYGRENIAIIARDYANSRNKDDKLVIIDLGAGYGTDLLNIKEKIGSRVVRYEAVENWEPYRKELSSKGIKSYSLDIERDKLPFKDSSVDIVVANQIIEHTKEIFWIFNEIHRVLKPGGKAIIGVPNIASFHNRVAMIFGLQPTSIELYSAHVRGITAGSFRRFIEKNKYFELSKVQGANFYPFSSRIARILAKIFPKASVGITLTITKTSKKGQFINILDGAGFETPFYVGTIPKQ
mgnify:CR=1 FL=1